MSEEHDGYSATPMHRAMEIAAIFTVMGTVIWSGVRVAGVAHAGLAGWIVGGLVFGYFLADFASGFVHWACDRYGSGETPFLGPHFIVPFREHHVDPKGITRHGLIETNGNTSIVAVPVLLMGHFLFDVESGSAFMVFAHLSLISLCAWTFGTNQFHKWAHLDEEEKHPVIRRLQSWGLILGSTHHKIHHRAPFETYYCITSGVLNKALHGMGFWWRSERLIFSLTGVRGGVDDRLVAGLDEFPDEPDSDEESLVASAVQDLSPPPGRVVS